MNPTLAAAALSSARHSPPLEESNARQTGLAAELSSARHSPALEESYARQTGMPVTRATSRTPPGGMRDFSGRKTLLILHSYHSQASYQSIRHPARQPADHWRCQDTKGPQHPQTPKLCGKRCISIPFSPTKKNVFFAKIIFSRYFCHFLTPQDKDFRDFGDPAMCPSLPIFIPPVCTGF